MHALARFCTLGCCTLLHFVMSESYSIFLVFQVNKDVFLSISWSSELFSYINFHDRVWNLVSRTEFPISTVS